METVEGMYGVYYADVDGTYIENTRFRFTPRRSEIPIYLFYIHYVIFLLFISI